MCKEGWCVALGQKKVVYVRVGNCLKYLKRWCNREDGRGNKCRKKIRQKFRKNFKNLYFWPLWAHFARFWGKQIFFKNWALSV